ncbi:MAG TPA: DUF4115 domain-containing protein [Thiolapillus brandeum]|uniref:DUF4115 domain-containing protein n=1 Tax=Thiolapillus brandeum TaxID=1076588 RepID=A0A831WGR5_9GAMM|nr:DUF4115 domain-containing protein [Thiolapillus brandeum]
MTVVKMQRRHTPAKQETPADSSIPSPGRRLQLAREAMGMEVATVAEQLHLSKELVHALEEENYEILPARVFVRGYYRNYARLVNVPEEIVLKEFGQRCPEGEDCTVPPAVAQGVRREIRSSHGLVRLATWLIVIALITVFGLWWKSYLDKAAPPEETVATEPKAEIQQQAIAAEQPVEAEQTSTETVPAAPAAESEETATVAADVAPAVAAVTPEETASAPVDSEAAVTTADTVSQPVVPPRVVLSFTGDCWVDVRDSSRSFKLVGRRKAGEKYELKGKPPYKMVLGNARNVSIMIDDKPFDLAPYTRGNVAKLTFDPAKN